MPRASNSKGIAEMAALTGLSRDTLRWYEREGLIPHVDRDHNGHRSYDDRAVRMVQLLVRLRRTGMPVAQMRRYVELVIAGESTHPERLKLLQQHRESVRDQLEQLNSDLDVLDHKIGSYQQLMEEKERE
ncbi:MAG: MerR family transcriptional regulator [Propionibacteriaceae bacterium]|nr:MerR family transcriptional regulator [Propionibacteriaceae bacterium]